MELGSPQWSRGRLGTGGHGCTLERARAGTREPQLQPAVLGQLVSLSQSSVLPPPPPRFEVVPENAARSQTLSVWKEATSSDGARSRHGCVA